MTTTNGGISHRTIGGISGGYVRNTAAAENQFFSAPQAFLGDISDAAGGLISVTRRLNTSSTSTYRRFEDIYVVGSGGAGSLVASLPCPPIGNWVQQSVPFLRGFWRTSCNGPLATDAEIEAILSNVANIYICAEYDNVSHTVDLDNVELRAGPSAADQTVSSVRWSLTDNTTPTARWRHAMAVDPVRNVLVLFGGDSGETDTWEYNLTSGVWARMEIAQSPSRRGGAAMAYDAWRGTIVMTGGGYFGTAYDEVWEYNARVTPRVWMRRGSLPQPRSGHAMVYDTARHAMVLYGGLATGVPGSLDILERSLESEGWAARTSQSNPDVQTGHCMAYDAARRKTVLIGKGTNVVDVWEWDGPTGTWVSNNVGGAPSARGNAAAAFDSSRNVVVLVGGENGGQSFRGTWDFNGASWTPRATMPAAAGTYELAADFDHVSNRVMVFGGMAGSRDVVRDIFAFRGTTSGPGSNTWSRLTTSGSPSPRYMMSMAYDEGGDRTILYGGKVHTRAGIVQQFSAATYSFRDGTWHPLTTANPDGTPPENSSTPLVYVPERRSMLMYGGTNGASNALREVWELHLDTNTWRNRTPPNTTPPGQRTNHAAAYDRAHRRMVVFGGLNDANAIVGSTWLLDPASNAWSEAAITGPTPGPRTEAAMAFDEARGVMVLFGGATPPASYYDDRTWEWNGEVWRDATPTGPRPTGRKSASLVYSPTLRAVVLIGGNTSGASAPQLEDVWAYNGVQWQPLTQAENPLPIARWLSGVAYDRRARRLLNFSGAEKSDAIFTTGQTWLAELPCPADINGDGFLDFFDYIDFVDAFETASDQADFNRDGFIDFFDYADFVEAFESAC